MADMLQFIDLTSQRLEEALVAEDWEAVKQIDDELRLQFRSMQQPSAESSQHMILVMKKLADTYQRVLQACEQHRNEIRREMMGVQRGRKGVMAYQSV